MVQIISNTARDRLIGRSHGFGPCNLGSNPSPGVMYNNTNSTWIDVKWWFYPRLVNNECAEELSAMDPEYGVLIKKYSCVHNRELGESCIACEGLSILSGTRR